MSSNSSPEIPGGSRSSKDSPDSTDHWISGAEGIVATIIFTDWVSALELIAKQYENMAVSSCASNRSSIQCQVMQAFLDSCFISFRRHVNVSNLQSVIATLLSWVEILDYDKISRDTLDAVYKY
ncbi:BMA-MXL-2, isoform b [Dirofilaria immitis]|nr:BMA-MXL-2, isoform b [Dirofilaria immitis]